MIKKQKANRWKVNKKEIVKIIYNQIYKLRYPACFFTYNNLY